MALQMASQRKLHIGTILAGTGASLGSWRHPNAVADGPINLNYYKGLTQQAEAAKLDFVFLTDGLYIDEYSHPVHVNCFEPLTLLAVLAGDTTHIGLAATLSTTYSDPFTAARLLASIDHISNGRVGWNIVTSIHGASNLNFSKPEHPEHDLGYRMADEFVEVTKGLWDSWEDDAFIRNKEAGVYFNPTKMHRLSHKGEFYSVQGPLSISRSKQGRPVLFQAGMSEAGMEFAARHADVVFINPIYGSSLQNAVRFYQDVKGLAAKYGRPPEEILILPACHAIVGETPEAAERKYLEMAKLVPIELALHFLGLLCDGIDFTQFQLDKPFPDLGESAKDWQKLVRERKSTLRQVAIAAASRKTKFIGTPTQVADMMQAWFEAGAADGFIMTNGALPDEFNDFIDYVLPILKERGLFRTEYEDDTLHGNLGLPKPVNRYAQEATD